MACCSNCSTCLCAHNLGCVDPCGNITIDETADATADYVLKLEYLGNTVEITAAQTSGEDMVFPAQGVNESFVFRGQIFDGDGDVVRVHGKEWIKFSTRKTYELA